jgi:ADP-ribose pyrophosphatase
MNWKTLSQKYLFQSPWLSLRQDKIELPNGDTVNDYIVTERKSVALIAALNDEDELLIKREYRYPIDADLWELPGGTFDKGEDPLECAKRELQEETGFTSENWSFLGSFYVNLFLAKSVNKTSDPILDEMEVINYKFVSLKKARQMVIENEIKVSGSALGILLL